MSSSLYNLPDNPTNEQIAQKLLEVAFAPEADDINAGLALKSTNGDIFEAFRSMNSFLHKYQPKKPIQDTAALPGSGIPEWPASGSVEPGKSTIDTFQAAVKEGRLIKVANIETTMPPGEVEAYIRGQPGCDKLEVHWPQFLSLSDEANPGLCFVEVPTLGWVAYALDTLGALPIGKDGDLTTATPMNMQKN